MDKGEERHDEVLEKLVARLAKKPGFISVKENYYDDKGVLRGEMDVHWMRKVNGRWVHRYYEVKARYSDGREECAYQQAQRHKQHNPNEEYRYVLASYEVVKRLRP